MSKAKPNVLSSSSVKAKRRARAVEGFGNAESIIGPVTPGLSLFAITRGQCSMVDVISYLLTAVGGGDVSVWTWAVSDFEVRSFEWFFSSGLITSARIVVDRSAEHRNPVLMERWRDKFGPDAVKVCKNHAKIATIAGGGLRLAVRGSMNLNENPRFEQFDVTEGGPEFDFIRRIESELESLPPMAANREADRITGAGIRPNQFKAFEGLSTWRQVKRDPK